jgi:cyclin-dependent kinase 7
MSAIREIKYLQELRHENITEVHHMIPAFDADLQLIDIYPSKSSLNLVLEFLDSDLEILIKDRSIIFQPADVKSWFLMLMRGLHHCHKNFVLHRVECPSSAADFRISNLPIY